MAKKQRGLDEYGLGLEAGAVPDPELSGRYGGRASDGPFHAILKRWLWHLGRLGICRSQGCGRWFARTEHRRAVPRVHRSQDRSVVVLVVVRASDSLARTRRRRCWL